MTPQMIRRVAGWVTEQPRPVSSADVARQFGLRAADAVAAVLIARRLGLIGWRKGGWQPILAETEQDLDHGELGRLMRGVPKPARG